MLLLMHISIACLLSMLLNSFASVSVILYQLRVTRRLLMSLLVKFLGLWLRDFALLELELIDSIVLKSVLSVSQKLVLVESR